MIENGYMNDDEQQSFFKKGFRIARLFGQVKETNDKSDEKAGSLAIVSKEVKSSCKVTVKSEANEKKSNYREANMVEAGDFQHNEVEGGEGEKTDKRLKDTQPDETDSNITETIPEQSGGFEFGLPQLNGHSTGSNGFHDKESTDFITLKESSNETTDTEYDVSDGEPFADEDEQSGAELHNEDLPDGEALALADLDELVESVTHEATLEVDESEVLTKKDLRGVKSLGKLLKRLEQKNMATKPIMKVFKTREISRKYSKDLVNLQVELLKLQRWVQSTEQRVIVIFEGLDAIGNRKTIRSFLKHLDPRLARVVALSKPTKEENGQWYFQRYANQLPKSGEIVLFDRSWYNRAIVEPVNDFCTPEQYGQFLRHVPEFESMLCEDGIQVIKLWFSVSKKEQRKRFKNRKKNLLTHWSLDKTGSKAHKHWSEYTHYKQLMFSRTHSTFGPWVIVEADDEKTARLESIKYVLSRFDYDGKDETAIPLAPDSNIVFHCHRPAVDTM